MIGIFEPTLARELRWTEHEYADIEFAQFVGHLWGDVAIIVLAAAAHQARSANLMISYSDLFPKCAIASVIGIGGTAGAVGGMMMTTYDGVILGTFKFSQPILIVAGSASLVAILLVDILSSRVCPVSDKWFALSASNKGA